MRKRLRNGKYEQQRGAEKRNGTENRRGTGEPEEGRNRKQKRGLEKKDAEKHRKRALPKVSNMFEFAVSWCLRPLGIHGRLYGRAWLCYSIQQAIGKKGSRTSGSTGSTRDLHGHVRPFHCTQQTSGSSGDICGRVRPGFGTQEAMCRNLPRPLYSCIRIGVQQLQNPSRR